MLKLNNKQKYNYYRYYSPMLGRYTQPDPIILDGGWNTYTYVENSTFNSVDPNGLERIVYSLQSSKNALLDGSFEGLKNYVGTVMANNTIYQLEEFIKSNNTTSEELLILTGHGSDGSLSGFNSDDLSEQIFSGNFKNSKNSKNNYFQNRIKNNLDIHIFLDSCNTGIINKNTGKNFATIVGEKLRYKITDINYKGKIYLYAPSGEIKWIPFMKSKITKDLDYDLINAHKNLEGIILNVQ